MRQVKWGIRRYVYLLLVLCLCFSQAIFAQAASAQTEDARTVRVAFLLKAEGIDENIIFPAHSYGTVYTTLIALEGSNLREDNAASKNPLVVGLWKQAKTRNSEVQSYLDTENFDYQLQYYDTHEEQYQALADGTVDVISNVSLSPIQGTRIIEKFAPRAYYFASSSKNEQLLKQLDETISIIGQVQPSLQDVLFDKFLRNTRYIFSPTDSQKEYLASLKTLKVLCVDHDAPYVYQKEGQPAGMLISVVNDFAEKSGLKVEYTFCENKTQAEEKLLGSHYDLMMGLPFTSRYCAQIRFVRSKSIMESNLAYLHHPSNTSRETVALELGLEDLPDTADFKKKIYCSNPLECIEALENGTADYAVGDRSGLEYYLFDTYSPMITSPISGGTQSICIAVSRDSDLQFIRLLNDYIYSMSDIQRTTFLEEGNAHVHKSSLKSYIRSHPVQAVFVFSVLTCVTVLGCSMILHAKRMRKKNIELEAANQAKSEFLTRMSHDIRTPMNGIIGLLDISDKFINEPDTVRQYHKKIRTTSEYLLSLINEVLDMSKLDSDEMVFVNGPTDLKKILKECQDILETRAAEHGLRLTAPDLDAFDPPRIITSELHLRQIIMNIVSNAIKYNKPNGTIQLMAEVVKQTEDQITCRFTVEDTGIGMSEEFQKHMFEPFSQEHGKDRSQLKGTGLGLSIVKRIIDKMGGAIQVESKKDVGTRFTWILTFPVDKEYKEKQTMGAESEGQIDLTGRHILAAEDNAINAEILEFILTDLGARVTLTENGKEAVDAFENSIPGEYDCIIMDVMMPVMDGYTASRTIRSLSRKDGATIPIIALTANAFAEDVVKAEEAGMNAHIAKPIDVDKLKKCLSALLG